MKHTVEIPKLELGETLSFDKDVSNIRINVEWVTKMFGIVCDLDLTVLFFSDRATFIEKIDSTNRKNQNCELISDLDLGNATHTFLEAVKIDLSRSDMNLEAILLLLDGGSRNYQHVQQVNMTCYHMPSVRPLSNLAEELSSKQTKALSKTSDKPKKDCHALALGIVCKNGWYDDGKPKWVFKAFMEPIYFNSASDADDKCLQFVVQSVPSLHKFRSRIFNSVREICAALSSIVLPQLKKKFLKSPNGLPIHSFTEVLFRQLYESYPKIIEEDEAAYLIVLIQEMFNQIDYNGDTYVDWDEFTSFIIQNSLVDSNVSKQQLILPNNAGDQPSTRTATNVLLSSELDEYTVNYCEDLLDRDHVLSGHRPNTVMRFVRENRKILVISEENDHILILDENFRIHSQLFPHKIQTQGSTMPISLSSEDLLDDYLINKKHSSSLAVLSHGPRTLHNGRFCIYDVIYLPSRDFYAFTASDHSIVICKEQTSIGGHHTNFFYHDKIYHRSIHLKLCWSNKNNLLCSVATDHTIYGWDIDRGGVQVFQINRHSDMITDFICVDEYDCFITCSMDKRIVMWSANTRRVRGVYLGHRRGVRSLSAYKSTLLSCGFECEARTWDITTKDPIAILQGHRLPIRAAKLMCEHAQTEADYRAITVDESGEFRLWNIYIKERLADAVPAQLLQVFQMSTTENILDQIKFIDIPFNSKHSTGLYSDVIACSSKLIRFIPEKQSKEFLSPSYSVFNDTTATLFTCAGNNVHKYDLCTGKFLCSLQNVYDVELTVALLDGVQGRRIFIGCVNGELILINSVTGVLIDRILVHSKEITGLLATSGGLKEGQRKEIYTCGMDGRIRSIEELDGKLHIHNTVESAFGDGIGVTFIKTAPSINVIVAASSSRLWGVWNEVSFKKLMVIHEESIVLGIEIIASSRDYEDKETINSLNLKPAELQYRLRENIITIAVALPDYIQLYSIDVVDIRGVATKRYYYSSKMFDTNMKINPFNLQVMMEDSVSSNVTSTLNSDPCSPTQGSSESSTPRIDNKNLFEEDSIIYITDMRVCKFPEKESVNSTKQTNSEKRLEGSYLIITTDDGKIMFWNINNVRQESESLFRKRYQGQTIKKPQRKKSIITVNLSPVHSISSNTELNSRHSTPFQSPNRFTNEDSEAKLSRKDRRRKHIQMHILQQKLISTDVRNVKDQEDSDLISLESMNKYHFLVEEHNDFNENIPHSRRSSSNSRELSEMKRRRSSISRRDSTSSSLSNHDLLHSPERHQDSNIGFRSNSISNTYHDNSNSNQSRKTSIKISQPIGIEGGGEYDSKIFYVLKRSDRLNDVCPNFVLHGHNDLITNIVLLPEHACICTVSLDGYHRIWNYDQECLGEMILPNVTEKMKKKRNELRILDTINNHKTISDVDESLNSFEAYLSSNSNDAILPWKFVMEKLQITSYHRKQAKLLCDSILNREIVTSPKKGEKGLLSVVALALLNSPKAKSKQDNQEDIFLTSTKSTMNLLSPQKSSIMRSEITDDCIDNNQNTLLSPSTTDKLFMNLQKGYPDDISLPTIPNSYQSTNITENNNDLRNSILQSLHEPLYTQWENSKPKRPIQSIQEQRKQKVHRLPPNSSSNLIKLKCKSNKNENIRKNQLSVNLDDSNQISTFDNNRLNRSDTANTLFSTANNDSLPRTESILSITSNVPSDIMSPDRFRRKSYMESSLWSTTDEVYQGKAHIPPAFSDSSLAQGLKEGVITGEEYQLLRKIGSNKEKIAVYDRSAPMMMLRNPTLTVDFDLPSKDTICQAEVSFGSQKDLYKNAVDVLNRQSHMSKSKIRNAVSLERIETSVRQIPSMIEILPAIVYEEVIVPNSYNLTEEERIEFEKKEKLNLEEELMRKRLETSASLVPIEAIAKSRPLSREFVVDRINKVEQYIHDEKQHEEQINQSHRIHLDNQTTISNKNHHKTDKTLLLNGIITKTQQLQLLRKRKLKYGNKDSNQSISSNDSIGSLGFIEEKIENIEKKLAQAIKDEYRNRTLLNTGKIQVAGHIKVRSASNGEQKLMTPGLMMYQQHQLKLSSSCKTKTPKNVDIEVISPISDMSNKSKPSSKHSNYPIFPSLLSPKNIHSIKSNVVTPVIQSSRYQDNGQREYNQNHIKQQSKVLTTRFLLPYYRLDDIRKFVDIFTKVDEDFSGDLDVKEWIKFFASLNRNLTTQDARMLFMKVDSNGDGQISLNELVPIVFGKANKEQLRGIINYVESEVIRKHTGSVTLTTGDVEQLFEAYDEECIGFISISIIRERVKSFNLPDSALFLFLDLIQDIHDDEMLNLSEFARILKPFTAKDK